MYPVIAYTIHLTTCVVLGFLLLTQKKEKSVMSFTYYSCLRIFAFLLLFNVPTDLLLFYFDVHNLNYEVIYPVFMPFCLTMFVGIIIQLFQRHLCVSNESLKWQNVTMWSFVVIFLMHPLLFVQSTCYLTLDNNQVAYESYVAYLKTDLNSSYLYFFYLSGAVYLMLCLFNFGKFLYYYYYWQKRRQESNTVQPVFRLLSIAAVPIATMCLIIIGGVLWDYNYYVDLPIWSVLMVLLSMYYLRNKEVFSSIAMESLMQQMENKIAMTVYHKELKNLSHEDSLYNREQAVISQAIDEWARREDIPFLNKKLTLASLSEEIDIPAANIIRHLKYSFGLNFEEYILFLREKHINANLAEKQNIT